MRTVVYADILLAVNWIVDYFLLVGTAVITGCMASRRRLLLGGALGGLCAFVFLAPPLPLWAQLLYQAASGTLVLLTAFRLRRPRYFIQLWIWYFLLNLCYAGLVLAAMYWLSFEAIRTNNLAFYYDVSPMLLVGCILIFYILLRGLSWLFSPPQADKVVWAQVALGTQQLHAQVLVDSGFTAQDVLLDQPLLLLSYPDTLGGLAAWPQARQKTGQSPQASSTTPGPGRKPDVDAPHAADDAQRLQHGLREWFGAAPPARRLAPGLRLIPLHTAAGPTIAPGFTAQAVINGRNTRVTLAFCEERFRAGQVQGLFGARSYEMIGGR